MTRAPDSRSFFHRKQIRRQRFRSLMWETLEARLPFDATQWLAVFDGLSHGETLKEQAQYGQNLLSAAHIGEQELRVVEALDLSGSFIVQTSASVPVERVIAELSPVPGFVYAEEYEPVYGPDAGGHDDPRGQGPLQWSEALQADDRAAALDGGSDYESYVAGEPGEPISDPSDPVESGPIDVLTNNNDGSLGFRGFTQMETSLVAFGNTVVVGYNDSGSNAIRANKFVGFSHSTDGGATFVDGGALPISLIGETGDPVLARDNTTGRIYYSAVAHNLPRTVQVFSSDDNGATWTAPVNGTPGSSNEDKPWITVDNFAGPGNGNVYLLSKRLSGSQGIYFYRSIDQGTSFGISGGTLITSGSQGAHIVVGPDHTIYAFWNAGSTLRMRKSTNQGFSFSAPVTVASGLSGSFLSGQNNGEFFFRSLRSSSNPHVAINPANGHIYVTYANNPFGVDQSDIFMVQSTNGGANWSAPVKINDDTTTNDQWQPTIAVAPDGSRLGIFYYSRQEDTTTEDGDPINNQFRYYGRIGRMSGSNVTFDSSFPVSSVPSKPEIGRDTIGSQLKNDYNQAVATADAFHVTWSDNRSSFDGWRMDPNVYYAKVQLGLSVIDSVPARGSVVSAAPTSFTINLTEPIDPSTLQASDLSVNGIPATSVSYTPGSTTLVFSYATSPVTTEGLQAIAISASAFARASDGSLVAKFNSSFRYDSLELAVAYTTPPFPDGTYTLPGPFTLDVTFNEPIAPASLQASDLMLSGMGGAYLIGMTVLPGNTTARFTIGGIAKEGAFTASVAAGAATDQFGNVGTSSFSATYQVDIDTVAYITPLNRKEPGGGLIYDPTVSGVINSAEDTDRFTLDIDPGQTITVIVMPLGAPTPSLAPTVELRDPAGVLLGSATGAAGSGALLQTIATATGGTYRIEVGGADSTGDYTVQVILNAAQEEEEVVTGAADDTRQTAQDLESSFITLATPQTTATRGAVLGRIGSEIASANFESGVLPASFITGSYTSSGEPDPTGRIQVKVPDGIGNSSKYALMMDKSTTGSGTLNEAIMTVDLSGASSATLSFIHTQINDEFNYLQSSFTGHYNGDGVAISADGIQWHTILAAPSNLGWTKFSIDLVAAAKAAGMTLGPNFQVKFQQYDDSPLPGDGRGYDDIMITWPEEDWYRFDLEAGEPTTLALKALSRGNVDVTLIDPTGATLETGTTGRTNVDKIISNFTVTNSGTYFAHITGSIDTDYSLVLTRNAAFDSEANDSQAQAQDISDVQGVLGNVDSSSPTQLYTTADNGTTLISIDQANGIATPIGPLGFSHTYATAFTPDGKLWTIVESNGSSARLATINLSTGAATPIGPSNWTGFPIVALEADPSGNLYAANSRGDFYSVNKMTGQLSLIRWLGSTSIKDFAFDQTGSLWAVAANGSLFKVNPLNGTTNSSQTIQGVTAPITGLIIDPADNTFYITTSTSNSSLYRLTPSAGYATVVGTGLGVAFAHGGDFTPSFNTATVPLTAGTGWWDDTGFHNAYNPTYFAGQTGGHQYRNYFVFDLSNISEPITGATFIATNGVAWRGPGYRSPDPSETFTLFDVPTPVQTVLDEGSNQVAVFDDLGSGTVYGSRDITAADNYHTVPITLNADGIAALNNALGRQIALGGAVTTISGSTDQQVFAFTGNSSDVKQLFLKFGSPDDWYSIDMPSVDDTLRLETSTPADGSGEFVNTLNPRIELYDPLGALVASGAAMADGRNEFIQYTPQISGKYRVRVFGEGGSRGEYFLSKNLSPVVNKVTVTSPIDENGVATINGEIRDADMRDSHTVVIDWGAGNGTSTLMLAAGVTNFTASHQYLDDAPSGTSSDDYPIRILVTDNHGASGGLATAIPTLKQELVVNGRFETGDLTGWAQQNSGSSPLWAINNGTYDPPGPSSPLAPISGGHDVVAVQSGPSTAILSQTIVVPNDISLATLSWSDRIRNYAGYFGDPSQEWRALILDNAGQLIQEIYSTKYQDPHIQLGPIHRAFDVTSLLQSLEGQTIQLSFQVQNFFNLFNATLDNVSLLVMSELGSIPEPAVATVNNVAPSDVTLSAGSIDENGTFTLTGSFVDPGTQDTHTVVIDWGDGQAASTVELPAGVTSFTASHQYLDDGPSPGNGTPLDAYAVRVSVTDDDQGAAPPATAETSVTVSNVAPHLVEIDPSVQTYVFAVGAPQNFAGSFADVGTLDGHSATWTFRHVVGLTTVVETRPATVSESSGSGTVADSFVFDNDALNQDGAGVYTVTLSVTDDDTGATTSSSRTFVVYDPSEGFVTGGGWIDSPAGAYVPDLALTGKATVGFLSKYQKGASTPTGQTEFHFQLADLNFHSESYDWLVVAGARAQYKGTGTINGAGNYGFMLTAIDGQTSGGGGVDKFRMKIWNRDDNDAVVYDNALGAGDDAEPATRLSGGSIVIHSAGRPLQADGLAAAGSTGSLLTSEVLRPAVSQAISAWAAAGIDSAQLDALGRVDVQLANLSGGLLGMASPANILWIDVDAAGYGWGASRSTAGMDLTSVVAHELGHILGLDDLPGHDDVMGSHLSAGSQRMPSLVSLQPLERSLLSGSPLAADAFFDPSLRLGALRWLHSEEERDAQPVFGGSDDLSSGVALLDRTSKKSWDAALLESLTDQSDDDSEATSEIDAALAELAEELAGVE